MSKHKELLRAESHEEGFSSPLVLIAALSLATVLAIVLVVAPLPAIHPQTTTQTTRAATVTARPAVVVKAAAASSALSYDSDTYGAFYNMAINIGGTANWGGGTANQPNAFKWKGMALTITTSGSVAVTEGAVPSGLGTSVFENGPQAIVLHGNTNTNANGTFRATFSSSAGAFTLTFTIQDGKITAFTRTAPPSTSASLASYSFTDSSTGSVYSQTM